MPHFILDCSESLFQEHDKKQVMRVVYDLAEQSGLFRENDVKVRLRSFADYVAAEGKDDFLHVFGYIMQGRTTEQKQALSRSIVTGLKKLFPDLSILSMNVMEFEKATYNNRNTV